MRVRQGAHTTAWLPTSQLMREVGPLAAMHEQTRLYIPNWLVKSEGLRVVDASTMERERAALAARRALWEERAALVETLTACQVDVEADEPRRAYDEALAECSFETLEQVEQRARDGHRYNIIAMDPSVEDNAQNRAQVYAYALIEHFVELMDARQYNLAIRECKHWMLSISEGRDGMEPDTKDAIWTVLCRVRAAANGARKSKPFTLSDLTERRQQELAALAQHARRSGGRHAR